MSERVEEKAFERNEEIYIVLAPKKRAAPK
jgi:hypothetical protein